MSNDDWHISVLVPACNEERLLPRCLESVLRASERLGAGASCNIVVASDCSSDRTAEVAERILGRRGDVVTTEIGRAGGARAVAAEFAIEGHRGPLARHWLANTDADTVVPTMWLADQLAYAVEGIHGLAGIVDVDSFAEHDPRVAERFRATYLLGPDGSHRHVHGANLGLRADMYLLAGGWSDLATGEDHDLWHRLAEVGACRLSTTRMCVLTSGRREGRAPHGFAEALAAHNETAA